VCHTEGRKWVAGGDLEYGAKEDISGNERLEKTA
jgi:hypothetical protein